MKKKYSIFILFIIVCTKLPAQNMTDSLLRVLALSKEDTSKVKVLNLLAEDGWSTNTSKSMEYSMEALRLAEKLNFQPGRISAYNDLGIENYFMGSYPEALTYFIKATELLEATGNNKKKFGAICNNIALICMEQKKFKEAEEYFRKSLKVDEELGDIKGMGDSYNNIGTLYREIDQNNEALDYFIKAFQYRKEANDMEGLPSTLTNLGMTYLSLNNYESGKINLEQALIIYKKNKDTMGISLIYNDIGDMYQMKKDYEKAILYFDSSLVISKNINQLSYSSYSYVSLSSCYARLKKFDLAYHYHCKYVEIKDSIFNKDNAEQLNEMQTKYETEKKEKEIKLSKAESEKQSAMKNAFVIGFVFMVLLAFFILRGYIIKRRANETITDQKRAVEIQKEIIETKSKEILDSISYAKRIQETILPPEKQVKELLPDSFILYMPKDIVSGDFYWFERWGDKIFFAAVDCTGHGVPGALMSVVGVNLLNKSLNELGLSKPNLILNALSKGIGKTLRQTGSDSELKDGMDLALCSLDLQKNILEYAGAFNPLWIIRYASDGKAKLEEIQSDKNPIGTYMDGELKNYTNHEIKVNKGDTIYIFTDGYADQFGGDKGKKYKYRALQSLLLSIRDQAMNAQRDVLERTILDWKGSLEQVDDILVIGVRI